MNQDLKSVTKRCDTIFETIINSEALNPNLNHSTDADDNVTVFLAHFIKRFSFDVGQAIDLLNEHDPNFAKVLIHRTLGANQDAIERLNLFFGVFLSKCLNISNHRMRYLSQLNKIFSGFTYASMKLIKNNKTIQDCYDKVVSIQQIDYISLDGEYLGLKRNFAEYMYTLYNNENIRKSIFWFGDERFHFAPYVVITISGDGALFSKDSNISHLAMTSTPWNLSYVQSLSQ